MTGEKKPLSICRQCERLIKDLMDVFKASRYVGPRSDVVLKSLVRSALAEYITARPEFLAEIEKGLLFNVVTGDREACFLAADAERKRLASIYHKTRRRLPGESLNEYTASGYSWRKATHDENTLAVLKAELERLREPLQGVSATEDKS